MKSRKLFALLLAFIWVVSALPSAAQAAVNRAQGEGLQMQAAAAYGGNFKYGEWLPVWVELENQGQDLNAEVRVRVSGSQGSTVFSAPVELPSGSRKSFPVYVLPNNFSRELQVDLVSGDELIVSQKVSVKPQPNITFIMGVASPERGALGLLNGVVLPGQNRPKILTDVLLSELTERPEGLRSFDVLVINNLDTSRLTPLQVSALEYWVNTGGRLVIGGGSGAQQTFAGLSETLSPVTLQGSIEIGPEALQDLALYAGSDEIQAAGPFVAAIGQPVESRILAGTESLPLVVERTLGSGAVDFVALDLSTVPFNGWPGTQAFWETLFGPGAAFPENMPFDVSPRQMQANQLGYALSNIPALDLPSIQGLSILLIIYILMVGPVNYLVLRFMRRMHLAWLTIPVITLLFTGGAFGIGYALRGNDLIMNQIALVEMQSGGTAKVTSYLGLFSPRQQSYEISVDGSGLVSPMSGFDAGMWGPNGQPITGSEMTFQQGQPSVVKGLTVNQFAMQSFMAEETWADFGQLTANLTLKNDTLVGTVRNDTNYKLTEVVVAIQNRFAVIGDMEPGQEATVDIGLGNLQADRFGSPLSYRLYQERLNPTGQYNRAIDLKINILSSVVDNQYYMKAALSSRFPPGGGGGLTSSNPVWVFGWLNEAPPEVEVRNNRISRQTTALVYTKVGYNMPDDDVFTIPVGMVPGSLTEIPPQGGTCGPMGTASVSMSMGEAEFEFHVPAEINPNRISELRLNFWRDNSADWGMPTLSVWDWTDSSWKTIQDPIMGVNLIKAPAQYVNEDGLIRMRLESDSNMYSCTYLDLGLGVEPGSGASQEGGAQ